MNVAIDLGNTRIKVAVFENDEIIERINIDEYAEEELKTFVAKRQPSKIILSSSGYVSNELEDYLSHHYFYVRLKTDTPVPITNLYKTPKTLGKDRLAAVVGATTLFPKENCIIVDAGTCITYELLNNHATYLGGNISPGISMRLQAMDEFTAALPLVDKQRPNTDMGYSTETAIRNGAVWGTVLEVDGFIQRFSQQLSAPKVILTGGDAELIYSMMNHEAVLSKDIVLIGLNKILEYNAAA